MLTRDGSLIEYEGCTEVTPGLYIGDDQIVIHDKQDEVISWTFDELMAEPELLKKVLETVALSAAMGPTAVRRNLVDRGTTMGTLVKRTQWIQGLR